MTIILSNLNRFAFFFTGRFPGKFAVKCTLKIPSRTAYVATLPCETLLSKQNKLLGVVGLLITKIKKGLFLSPRVIFFKSVNIWQSYKQERGCLMHFTRLANTLLKDEERARDNHVFACNFVDLSPI